MFKSCGLVEYKLWVLNRFLAKKDFPEFLSSIYTCSFRGFVNSVFFTLTPVYCGFSPLSTGFTVPKTYINNLNIGAL